MPQTDKSTQRSFTHWASRAIPSRVKPRRWGTAQLRWFPCRSGFRRDASGYAKQIVEYHGASAGDQAAAFVARIQPVSDAATTVRPVDGMAADGAGERAIHPDTRWGPRFASACSIVR